MLLKKKYFQFWMFRKGRWDVSLEEKGLPSCQLRSLASTYLYTHTHVSFSMSRCALHVRLFRVWSYEFSFPVLTCSLLLQCGNSFWGCQGSTGQGLVYLISKNHHAIYYVLSLIIECQMCGIFYTQVFILGPVRQVRKAEAMLRGRMMD